MATSAASAPDPGASAEIPVSPNPWDDGPKPAADPTPKPVAPLDPSVYEQSDFAGLKHQLPSPAPKPDSPDAKELLKQFDPLESSEEKAARDAWQSADGNPPPPPPPRTPSPPLPPMKDLYITSPTSPDAPPLHATSPGPSATAITSPTSFPSFAAFARSFTLPLVRSRPQSMDGSAKAVPSPSTISSFANQQDATKDQAKPSTSSGSGTSTPNRTAGTSSPVPKPDGGFDFQKFLDQMKTRSADPVSKYLRSFLSNFAKRTFTLNDQVKIISDFLSFIAVQMRECDVWRNASDADFENAMEGMEKLVMNRLYDFTFTPQLIHAVPPRPITTDDLERDRVLSQRIALFGWLEEKHLDVPEGEGSKGFLMFAQQELLKINHYKAPRDKLICILNSCKVIFGLIRHLHQDEGADSFLPILIFVVLKANPEHLLSNVEFINRFRNPAKLQSEAGYYLSSLIGAVSFIETMDHTSLSNITQAEFEKNVEEAIQALPPSEPHSPETPFADVKIRGITQTISPHAGEESAQPLAIATPPQTLSEDAKRLLQKTGDTISKPLNAIGRIFSEALDGAENKLSYLPGPFAPFELGRENRQEASGSGSGRPPPLQYATHPQTGAQITPATASSGHSQPPQTPFQNYEGPHSAPIQTPYKQRVRRVPSPSVHSASAQQPAWGSPGWVSPGWGNPEDTPSKPGPYTNQPLTMGPSQPYPYSAGAQGNGGSFLQSRMQSLSAGATGGLGADLASHISRTPTPALDLAGVQAQIDAAHDQAASASRATLVQIFPGVDGEIIDWVLEANDGDLGKSIEQLLDISGTGDPPVTLSEK